MQTPKSVLARISTVSLLALALLKCSGGSDSGSSSENLLETCSGTYTCSGAGETVTGSMQRNQDSCYIGAIRLDPDGRAVADGDEFSWYGDAKQFSICASDDCMVCKSDSATSQPSTPVKKSCKGSPGLCPSSPPCADKRGCDLDLGWDTFGNPDNSCSGSPDSCESMVSEQSCVNQGCSWE